MPVIPERFLDSSLQWYLHSLGLFKPIKSSFASSWAIGAYSSLSIRFIVHQDPFPGRTIHSYPKCRSSECIYTCRFGRQKPLASWGNRIPRSIHRRSYPSIGLNLLSATAGKICQAYLMEIESRGSQDGRSNIDVLNDLVHWHFLQKKSRAIYKEWNLNRLFIKMSFINQSMFAHTEAIISHVDNQRIFIKSFLSRILQHRSDTFINSG